MRHALALALLAAPAMAQDLPFAPEVIEQCLATGLGEGCIGLAARVCVGTAGPMSEGLCAGNETAWWQARAEARLAALAPRNTAAQARAVQRGAPATPLAAVEAAFLAYREAACDWVSDDWDGVHSGFAWAGCRLRLTAQHALWLDGLGGA